MKSIWSLLFLLSCLFSCNRKLADPGPILTPVKVFFESINSVNYKDNAEIIIQFKIFPFNIRTTINIDWGDGKNEQQTYFIKDSDFQPTVLEFSHKYEKNGNYAIRWTATNAVMTDSTSKEVIITNKVPKPKADFSYEILTNGKVTFKNLSSDSIASFSWSDNKNINRSILKNPEFTYEWNGNYVISLTVHDNFGQWDTIYKEITITNAISRELGTFKGIIFNENYDFVENQTDCKTGFREIEVDPVGSLLIYYFSKNLSDKRIFIEMLGVFRVSSGYKFNLTERYEKFKKYLTVGQKKVGANTEDAWNVGINIQTKEGIFYKALDEDPKASIEITEVREIDQPALFEVFYPKAFWVTFKIKADFKEVGKVDGTLKMRYLIYKL